MFDDQRAVRKHVAVFVNGQMVPERVHLTQWLGAGDQGQSWQEIAAPAFPVKPTDGPWADDPTPWSVDLIWSLAAGGANERGTLWAGCLPAGLFKSEDGGASFQIFSDGLPQRQAYHLVYRHGLDVTRDGQTLALASTTGGLWLSADAGLGWQCLSHDLPLVAALRFTD